MFSPDDTVVAIATPPGRGGIGVVRISGPCAGRIAGALLSRRTPLAARRAALTHVRSGQAAIDRVVATYFPAPASYTGQDVVEISAHGSPVVLQQIVRAAVDAGARLAEPGEFTLRAYLNGRLDLVQAEAVGDLIEAVTPLQARAAFDQLEGTLTTRIRSVDEALFDLIARLEASVDFPDEGYHFVDTDQAGRSLENIEHAIRTLLADAGRGRLIREGLPVAIVGKPNVGKSSLFNALLGAARAIVSDTPGTTRDLVSEVTEIDGIRLDLVDTAGIRESRDRVEVEGVARARGAAEVAEVVLVVLDRSRPLEDVDDQLLESTKNTRRVVVINKMDLPAAWVTNRLPADGGYIELSLISGEGLETLRPAIGQALGGSESFRDRPGITNIRHIVLLERAAASIARARHAMADPAARLSEEFVLADLQDGRAALEEITGKRAPGELLEHIFRRFCIGK